MKASVYKIAHISTQSNLPATANEPIEVSTVSTDEGRQIVQLVSLVPRTADISQHAQTREVCAERRYVSDDLDIAIQIAIQERAEISERCNEVGFTLSGATQIFRGIIEHLG